MVENGGYTELISEGEGITIEKGKISVTGGSGGSGGGDVYFCTLTESGIAESYNDLSRILSDGKIPVVIENSSIGYAVSYIIALHTQDDGEGGTIYNAVFMSGGSEEVSPYVFFAENADEPLMENNMNL